MIDIGLGELALEFETEKVDLNMLISMPKDDFKTLLVDFDLKWGERYKLENAITFEIDSLASVSVDTSNEVNKIIEAYTTDEVAESVTTINEVAEIRQFQECELCNIAKDQNNPLQKFRLCGKVACSIYCSIPDPSSDNEIHRVHKKGDTRCTHDENGMKEGVQYHCPKCEKIFLSNENLQMHVTAKHKLFRQDFKSFTLISNGTLSDVYEKCFQCENFFENEFDLKTRKERS